MRAYGIDDEWERLTYRYQQLGRPVPRRWLWLYRGVRALIAWGSR